MYRGSFYSRPFRWLDFAEASCLEHLKSLLFFLRFLLAPWRPNNFGDFLYILFHIQKVKEYQLQFYVVVQKSTELQGDKKSTKGKCSPWFYLPIIKDYLSALWQPCMKLMYNNGFIHTAGIIKNWVNKDGDSFVDWLILTRFEPCWAWIG